MELDKSLILIVEDDPLLSDLVSLKLINAKIPVEHAANGEVALEFLRGERKPDLVLLDIRLPGVDGFTVLEKIRSDESTKNLPVIIFSNLGEEKDKARAAQLGATRFAVKSSLSLDEVVAMIKEVLSK